MRLPAGAWPNWVLGNHDNPRIATRVGASQARVAAMLLLTLPGTITLYYGEEIGMTNVPIAPEHVQDPREKNEPGLGQGRDPERTPMPWNVSASAGFTTGTPWLPLGDNAASTVAALEHDPRSILMLYRRLIDLRRARPTLISGKLQGVLAENGVLRYERASPEDRILVLLNMSKDSVQVAIGSGTVLASTNLDRDGQKLSGTIMLEAAEGLILNLDT